MKPSRFIATEVPQPPEGQEFPIIQVRQLKDDADWRLLLCPTSIPDNVLKNNDTPGSDTERG